MLRKILPKAHSNNNKAKAKEKGYKGKKQAL